MAFSIIGRPYPRRSLSPSLSREDGTLNKAPLTGQDTVGIGRMDVGITPRDAVLVARGGRGEQSVSTYGNL